ncbi:hypothetical protein PIB30_114120, partial [Stylosanthes scabra]|nr:hypothetical protein [Stylosanthes scabra]
TPEEARELIENIADASQHFRTRATAYSSKGVFGVTPNESPDLVKAMGDIASVLKDIREGQQNLLNVQHQQHASQVEPPKHCGICACTSHFTDECPQLQEDHTIAATHNFYDQPSSNTNNQSWRNNQASRWNQPNNPN